MVVVDTKIKDFLSNENPESESRDTVHTKIYDGNSDQVKNIGYDLQTKRFYRDSKSSTECTLNPGESVFVESEETIYFGSKMTGIVSLRNSRIRMGLRLDSPRYQPCHKTRIYFRLTNISSDALELRTGEDYAMLIFDQLEDEPSKGYDGTYQKEFSFKGLADYKSVYRDQIQSVEGKIKNLQEMERSIYGNVITILTIFVTIFTLLNVNIELAKSTASAFTFLNFNLAILGGISFLSVFLSELFGRNKGKKHFLWIIPLICFVVLILINLL